jgi:type IV pilus assembly protein PilE
MIFSQRGMTLIELMIVVVVVAILASIAVPSYRSYMVRANRTEAKTALLQLQVAQEKYYLQRNEYTDNVTAAPTAGGLGLSGVTDRGLYTITVDPLAGDTQAYTARATPVAGSSQAGDSKCTQLSIDHTGRRGSTGSGTPDLCWR